MRANRQPQPSACSIARRLTCTAALLALLAAVPDTAGAGLNQWTSNGPESGAIASLAIDPSNPANVYALTYSGGIFKSVDAAAQWTPANDGLTSRGLRFLVVDPHHPTTLYTAAYDQNLVVSRDGGLHWRSADDLLRDNVFAITFDPVDPDTVYATTDYGVFRSTDGGQSWYIRNQGLPVKAAERLVAGGRPSSTLYALYEKNRLFRSRDHGDSWQAVGGLPTDCGDIVYVIGGGSYFICLLDVIADPQAPGTVYVAASDAGVFKSTDNGDSWTPINAGLLRGFPGDYVTGLAMSQNRPDALAAATTSGIFLTTDAGDHWSPATGRLPSGGVNTLALDPNEPSILYAGAGAGTPGNSFRSAGVFKSIDSGATWTAANHGLVNSNVCALGTAPVAPFTIYAGMCDDSVPLFVSADGGASWVAAGTGLPAAGIASVVVDPTNPAHVYAMTRERGVYVSSDRGASWERTNSGDLYSGELVIDPQAPGTLYAGSGAAPKAGVLKTTNGGGSWKAANSGLPTGDNAYVRSLAIDPLTTSILYASLQSGGVYKSTDAASTWTRIDQGTLGSTYGALLVDPTTPTTIYLDHFDGFRRSTDGGATWKRFTPESYSVLAVDPITPGILYISDWYGQLRRSTDAGVHWTDLGAPITGGGVRQLLLSPLAPNTVFAATNSGGVMVLERNELTPLPTVIPTPTPPVGDCVGDCNLDREVTVDELIFLVNVALGNEDAIDCDDGDQNLDGDVTIDEILRAVNSALNSCL